ncbi:MAG: hypothetical protein LUH63_06225 [Parabacteroides sp.]|nr:hypothetical protein [Parabacteroides sp.]
MIQERDYETGKVYLRAVPKATANTNGAKLNASLWKIEYSKEDGVSGGYFRYVNKETNLPLTFDHSVIENNKVSELRDEIADWSWYTVNTDAKPFDLERVYSYLHNQAGGEVMYLTFADKASNNGSILAKLAAGGFKYSASVGKLVQAKVISSTAAGTGLGNVKAEALQLRPVVAMPFVMTADQFNTRMDADLNTAKDTFSFKMNKALIGSGVFTDGPFFTEYNHFSWNNNQTHLSSLSKLNATENNFVTETQIIITDFSHSSKDMPCLSGKSERIII